MVSPFNFDNILIGFFWLSQKNNFWVGDTADLKLANLINQLNWSHPEADRIKNYRQYSINISIVPLAAPDVPTV